MTAIRDRLVAVEARHEAAINDLFNLEPVYRYLFDGAPPGDYVPWLVGTLAQRPPQPGIGGWIIEEDGRVMTYLEIREGEHNGGRELIWIVHPDWWGRGIATALARIGQELAFAVEDVGHVWAATDAANLASQRVMEKSGMHFWKMEDMPLGPGPVWRIYRP
ncbi:MAG: GNAT family protein [Rhizobiaceae bacterium]